MSKSREAKGAMVAELKEKFSRAQSFVLADYRGLTVEEVGALRRKLQESGVEFKVVKNTLAGIAARDAGLEGLDRFLEGPTAIAFSPDDPVSPAKGLLNFIEERKKMEIKVGVLNGRVIDFAAVKSLARLPSRNELLAQVLGVMRAPLAGFAGCLQAPLRGFVTAADALQRKNAQA